MLGDIAALTPPVLVCAAFLVAVAAFLRHEMRGIKNPEDRERSGVPAHSENPDDRVRQAGSGDVSGIVSADHGHRQEPPSSDPQ